MAQAYWIGAEAAWTGSEVFSLIRDSDSIRTPTWTRSTTPDRSDRSPLKVPGGGRGRSPDGGHVACRRSAGTVAGRPGASHRSACPCGARCRRMAQLAVGPVAGRPVSGTRRDPSSYAEPSRPRASQEGNLALAGALAVTALAACSTNRADPAEPRTCSEVTSLNVAAPLPAPTTTTTPSIPWTDRLPPLRLGPGLRRRSRHRRRRLGHARLPDRSQVGHPGVNVQASVGQQWTTGLALLQQAKSANQLGAVVIVGLGTNGPITTAQFDSTTSVLSGASRVDFVNVFVDRGGRTPTTRCSQPVCTSTRTR